MKLLTELIVLKLGNYYHLLIYKMIIIKVEGVNLIGNLWR